MRISFFCFALFFCSICCFSQTSNQINKNNWDWFFANSIGFTTIEAKNSFKVNATVYGGIIGKEFKLGRNSAIVTGVEILRIKADFNDSDNQQHYLNNNYINVPLTFQFSYLKEQKVSVYGGIGIYGSYLYKSVTENIVDDTDDTVKGVGANFGLQANIGSRFVLSDRFNFRLGIQSKTDILTYSDSSVQEFKLIDFYAFQFGIGFKL